MPSAGPSSTSVGSRRMFVVASTTKSSFRWSIASLRVSKSAGRLGQSGCSAQRTSPRFTRARARPPATRWPVAASFPRCSPHAAWRGRPIRRPRRRSPPHGERAQPAPRSNVVRVVGAFPSRSRLVRSVQRRSHLRPPATQALLGANHSAAGSRLKGSRRPGVRFAASFGSAGAGAESPLSRLTRHPGGRRFASRLALAPILMKHERDQ
jgi:hypothetical protein